MSKEVVWCHPPPAVASPATQTGCPPILVLSRIVVHKWASAVDRWVADTRMGLRHAATDPSVYTLYYEDLLARPAEALTAVLWRL